MCGKSVRYGRSFLLISYHVKVLVIFFDMRKQYFIFIGILVFALVFYFFFQTETTKNYPSQGTDIIAFGDSLVYGTGASSEKKNFVSLLSVKLGKPIINLGIPGNTTADGIARLHEIDRYKPRVVMLLLGGNDRLQKISEDTTFRNLGMIIQNLQSRGAVVIVLGIRGGVLGDTYEDDFKALKSTYHTAYVSDVLDGLFGNPKLMSDVVHPNDEGYSRIADKVYPVLLKLTEK